MLFNSAEFVLFFVAIVLLYFSTPYRWRWALLLAGSYYFYMAWKPKFILLIIASTLLDYGVGRLMEVSKRDRSRRALLVLSLAGNLGLLFAFKYLDFFSEALNMAFSAAGSSYRVPLYHLILPVGISFYTFQTLSYTIDVYRRKTPVEKHLGIFALYVAFFPQLVAGPIERSSTLLPQFRNRNDFSFPRLSSGLRLMLWGMFKKLVIADLVAVTVERVYGAPQSYAGPLLLLATVFFAIQIYCDFSGYSDIAVGAARVLGYDLMVNFRQPYFSRSIAEFWRRWHISLSTWFRDYVYIPLGGSRVGQFRLAANLLAVFAISGLWHGAAWNFILWGALHGVCLAGSIATAGWRARLTAMLGLDKVPRLQAFLQTIICFSLVLIGWVFFRAASLGDAVYILTNLLRWSGPEAITLAGAGLGRFQMLIALLGVASLFVVDFIAWKQPRFVLQLWDRREVRFASYAVCFYSIVFFGVFDKSEFIYFQF